MYFKRKLKPFVDGTGDRVQQGRIEQTLLDIGRSRNLRLEIDIAKNYGDVEKYSQYFDHYQLYLLDLEIDGERDWIV